MMLLALLLLVLAPAALAGLPLRGYSHQWVVRIPGGDAVADTVAAAHAMVNHGRVRRPRTCAAASARAASARSARARQAAANSRALAS